MEGLSFGLKLETLCTNKSKGYSNGQLAYFSPENDEEDARLMNEAFAMRDDEAWSSDKMTAKVPPAYDGITSFFAYEEYAEE